MAAEKWYKDIEQTVKSDPKKKQDRDALNNLIEERIRQVREKDPRCSSHPNVFLSQHAEFFEEDCLITLLLKYYPPNYSTIKLVIGNLLYKRRKKTIEEFFKNGIIKLDHLKGMFKKTFHFSGQKISVITNVLGIIISEFPMPYDYALLFLEKFPKLATPDVLLIAIDLRCESIVKLLLEKGVDAYSAKNAASMPPFVFAQKVSSYAVGDLIFETYLDNYCENPQKNGAKFLKAMRWEKGEDYDPNVILSLIKYGNEKILLNKMFLLLNFNLAPLITDEVLRAAFRRNNSNIITQLMLFLDVNNLKRFDEWILSIMSLLCVGEYYASCIIFLGKAAPFMKDIKPGDFFPYLNQLSSILYQICVLRLIEDSVRPGLDEDEVDKIVKQINSQFFSQVGNDGEITEKTKNAGGVYVSIWSGERKKQMSALLKAAKLLLNLELDVNKPVTKFGKNWNLVVLAAFTGDAVLLELVLKKGADFNHPITQHALNIAIFIKYTDCAKVILDYIASCSNNNSQHKIIVNLYSENIYTPLDYAVLTENIQVVKLVLEHIKPESNEEEFKEDKSIRRFITSAYKLLTPEQNAIREMLDAFIQTYMREELIHKLCNNSYNIIGQELSKKSSNNNNNVDENNKENSNIEGVKYLKFYDNKRWNAVKLTEEVKGLLIKHNLVKGFLDTFQFNQELKQVFGPHLKRIKGHPFGVDYKFRPNGNHRFGLKRTDEHVPAELASEDLSDAPVYECIKLPSH